MRRQKSSSWSRRTAKMHPAHVFAELIGIDITKILNATRICHVFGEHSDGPVHQITVVATPDKLEQWHELRQELLAEFATLDFKVTIELLKPEDSSKNFLPLHQWEMRVEVPSTVKLPAAMIDLRALFIRVVDAKSAEPLRYKYDRFHEQLQRVRELEQIGGLGPSDV